MKSIILSLCFGSLFFLNHSRCEAQISEFEKIFLKEIQAKETGITNFGTFKHIDRLSYYPDSIPSWFFSLPQADESSTYAVGISDPDMPQEEAMAQAIYRAKVLAVVFNMAKLQYFRDIYTTELTEGRYTTYRQRFDTYFKVSGGAIADSTNFELKNQHFTRYNEAIALIRYTPSNGETDSQRQLFSASGTVLFIEAQLNEAFEFQAEYELTASAFSMGNAPLNSYNMYREKGNKFLYQSFHAGKENDFPLYYYKYVKSNSEKNTLPLNCYNGLWSQYLKELLKILTLTTEQSKVRIQSVEDMEFHTDAALFREVAVKNVRMHLIGIEFGSDSIGFDFNITDLP